MDTETKRKHRQAGLCTQCHKKAIEGLSRCERHHHSHIVNDYLWKKNNPEIIKKTREKMTKKYKEEGRCIGCGIDLSAEIDGGHVKCMNCRTNLYGTSYVPKKPKKM